MDCRVAYAPRNDSTLRSKPTSSVELAPQGKIIGLAEARQKLFPVGTLTLFPPYTDFQECRHCEGAAIQPEAIQKKFDN